MRQESFPVSTSLMPMGIETLSFQSKQRFLIITDAWEPQVNGVVTTLKNLSNTLSREGFDVHLLTPESFKTLPTFYPTIQVALPWGVSSMIEKTQPHYVLIATEGPLGLAGRHYCVQRNIPFVTSFTTRWPEYFQTHLRFPPLNGVISI